MIRVHIQELVLHGFSPADRRGMGDAVQRELSRLLEAKGLPPSLHQARSSVRSAVDAGSFVRPEGARAEHTGAQVAQAVYRGLSR